MAVTILCPACNVASEFAAVPLSPCPRCGTPLPDAVRGPAEAALRSQRPAKPLLIALGTVATGFAGAVVVLMVLGTLLIRGGTYTVNDVPVSRDYWIRHVLPWEAAGGLAALGLAWAMWRERPWTRELMLGWWVVVDVVMLAAAWGDPDTRGQLPVLALWAVVYLVAAGWYLYGKRNVVEYYRALTRREDTSARGLA